MLESEKKNPLWNIKNKRRQYKKKEADKPSFWCKFDVTRKKSLTKAQHFKPIRKSLVKSNNFQEGSWKIPQSLVCKTERHIYVVLGENCNSLGTVHCKKPCWIWITRILYTMIWFAFAPSRWLEIFILNYLIKSNGLDYIIVIHHVTKTTNPSN